MRLNKHGYSPIAFQLRDRINKFREHVEMEKFLCRMLIDNDDTREFEENTRILKNKLYNLRFNSAKARNLTKAGKKEIREAESNGDQ